MGIVEECSNFFGYCAFSPLGIGGEVPKGVDSFFLYHNLGASTDGVHIRRALGWDVEMFGVILSHSSALMPALPYCSNPILS